MTRVGSVSVWTDSSQMMRMVISFRGMSRCSSCRLHAENMSVSRSYARVDRRDTQPLPCNFCERLIVGVDYRTTFSTLAYVGYTFAKAFEPIFPFRRSDNERHERYNDKPRERVTLTHSMIPGQWDDGGANHDSTTACKSSWLRSPQSRGLHTHEPPFYEVYPRLSDPPIDN